METEKSECNCNIRNHVLQVVREIAFEMEAVIEEDRYDWEKLSQDALPRDLRAVVDHAKTTTVESIAFNAFDDAWSQVLEGDAELSVWFALKIWALVLISETEEDPNPDIREDAVLAAKYLCDVAGVIEHRSSKRVQESHDSLR